jgi:uncharacterized damage-inducible protein DinB
MDIQKELITEYERETATTRKILEAIPDDADFTWKPHPKSMALGKLAGHVSDTNGDWALHTLTVDKLEWNPSMASMDPHTKVEILAKFDKQTAGVKAELAKFPIAKWDTNWKFVAGDQTWIDDSKYNVWRTWVLNHLVHHRAQLGVYIRLLDAKLPGCYGPSADEM